MSSGALRRPLWGALRNRLGALATIFCLLPTYVVCVSSLYERPRASPGQDMQVALPRFVQVIMAMGDRYLAANISGFRTLVASTDRMDQENYEVQAQVQKDIAWLNPAHEDNFYLAAALLSWNGQVSAAQEILSAANQARPFDWLPAFYYAFNMLHFENQPEAGASWLRVAAEHTSDEMQRLQLIQLASLWLEKGEDRSLAIKIVRAMANEARYKPFAAYLEKRAIRLENQLAVERATAEYLKRFGVFPDSLRKLVVQGFLDRLPDDPFGEFYKLRANGQVVISPTE